MDIKPSVFAVFKDQEIVGTGFLVSRDLAVTCAHVVNLADAQPEEWLKIRFSGHEEEIDAYIVEEYWRDVDAGDIAFLKLESTPEGVMPLRLSAAKTSQPGNAFSSFGYAIAADIQGIIARGTIDGYLPDHNLLQMQAPQANQGISGAPVLDEKRGVVVGMITKGHTELGRNEFTTFATPTETIWQVCPQLKPPTPILPRRNPIVEGINLLPYDYDQRIQNFLTEYLGTDEHPVPFGGRDDALRHARHLAGGDHPLSPAGRPGWTGQICPARPLAGQFERPRRPGAGLCAGQHPLWHQHGARLLRRPGRPAGFPAWRRCPRQPGNFHRRLSRTGQRLSLQAARQRADTAGGAGRPGRSRRLAGWGRFHAQRTACRGARGGLGAFPGWGRGFQLPGCAA